MEKLKIRINNFAFLLCLILLSNTSFAYVDVTDYGAVGDGKTDATTAVETADSVAKNTNTDQRESTCSKMHP